ncbi:MAG: cation:proton antiporter [Desulfobacter sp.]|nr:MAG: cation:proton antiporter [Desulfobacter sp.]
MDTLLIVTAFLFGFAARQIGLPPLVGFLAAGFALNMMGVAPTPTLYELSDIGIILLLFSIGLKVKIKELLIPQVWGVAALHMAGTIILMGLVLFGFSLAGVLYFARLDMTQALMIAFALSFSSTVFAVKILEEKGDMGSNQGRLAIGILIMQDLFAVIFITLSSGKWPSPMAIGLLGLYFLRKPLSMLLNRSGHGELLVLLACILPIAGASVFEYVGLKPDLGALILGMLLAGHPKTDELAKAMFGFKDLFLVGFFLTIGMAELPVIEMAWTAMILVAFIPLKAVLFFILLTRFSLRSRTALLTTMNLANYSEFGLIVGALGVNQGWLGSEWLVILAVALSVSMVAASPTVSFSSQVYSRWNHFFQKFEKKKRLPADIQIDTQDACVAVFGMGRVGTGAYDNLRKKYGQQIIGVDSNLSQVAYHLDKGRNVIHGDAEDCDFWQRGFEGGFNISLVLLTMPHAANLAGARQISEFSHATTLAATATFDDEIDPLKIAGVDQVFNIYSEAGAGFSNHISQIADDLKKQPRSKADHGRAADALI